jgi:hypothetical protein
MYGSCPALLLEPQRTNLALYSEDATQWTKGQSSPQFAPVVTANQVTSPDGTTNADKVVFPAVSVLNSYSLLSFSFIASAASYSGSVWMRGESGGEVVWIAYTTNGITYTQTLCTLTTSWQRFVLTSTLTSAFTFFQIGVDLRDTAQSAKPSQTIYVYGRQIELGAHPTTIIPTTTASATRIADTATTGTTLQSAGILGSVGNTAFYNVTIPQNTNRTGQFFATLVSGSVATNSLGIVLSTASIQVRSWFGGTGQLNYTLATNPTTLKIALSYVKSTKTIKIFVNGSLATTVSSIDFADYTYLALHDVNSNTQTTSLFYHQIALFNSALSDSDCIALTT